MRAYTAVVWLATAAAAVKINKPRILSERQFNWDEQEEATYDDACNIGYCSVFGATIGGWGAEHNYVKTVEEFTAAVTGTEVGVIIVDGDLRGDGVQVAVGSSKTIVGNPGSSLSGISLLLANSRNVIVRNLVIANTKTDAIVMQSGRSIWLDHLDISASEGKLVAISQGSDYISITHNKFHGFSHASESAVAIGLSDNTAAEDTDKFHITFARNHFINVTNALSFRLGTGHIFNSLYEMPQRGVDIGNEGKVLVERSVFDGVGTGNAVYSSDGRGYATVKDTVVVGAYGTFPPEAHLSEESVVYPYDWFIYETAKVKEVVSKWAGQTLKFMSWD
ncbi:pectin lyase fold/virulence factor [Triangularia verruculosa]|uniref:Pectin lyase fold/virulence factor n=1 Tax=Triangularia verruculosa TaxID=2587418 RepID=A0AAN6XHG9_9PEZI|nr:pectin lyase fold/virulence factor [Triangularia verruculosa]